MNETSHDSHPEHPPTKAYARTLSLDPRSRLGSGYDGAQQAFGPWQNLAEAGGGVNSGSSKGGDRFPKISQSESEAQAARDDGFEQVAGLWLPEHAVAQSWARLVAQVPRLDLSHNRVVQHRVERPAGCDWKIFVEIYCDDYHVEPAHPGLASLADCGQLRWIWDEHAQAQIVGSSSAGGSGSPAHQAFVEHAQEALGPKALGAVWALIYPATMVEWLAGGVALSTLVPTASGACVNRVEFIYPASLLARYPGFAAAHQLAYWETAREDDKIAQRIQAGRDALAAAGRDERGPAHPHLEAGVVEFHRWLARAPWSKAT